jgi:hypothetical protein
MSVTLVVDAPHRCIDSIASDGRLERLLEATLMIMEARRR